MTGRDGHAGDLIAALVDGRLSERERQPVLDHVAACRACLAEYDAQLALKGLLRGLPDPGAPDHLRARLTALPSAPVVDHRRSGGPHRRHDEPRPSRPSRPSSTRAAGASRATRATRATRAGATLLTLSVVTVAAAYVLGGAPEGESVVPPTDQYVREHAAVSVSVPLTRPVLSQLVVQPVPYALPTVLQDPSAVRETAPVARLAAR